MPLPLPPAIAGEDCAVCLTTMSLQPATALYCAHWWHVQCISIHPYIRLRGQVPLTSACAVLSLGSKVTSLTQESKRYNKYSPFAFIRFTLITLYFYQCMFNVHLSVGFFRLQAP